MLAVLVFLPNDQYLTNLSNELLVLEDLKENIKLFVSVAFCGVLFECLLLARYLEYKCMNSH